LNPTKTTPAENASREDERATESNPDHAINTQRLTRTFGDLVAVDDLDLAVTAGTFFGFLGPNGAGKSTTIKILTGLLDKTSGTAEVLGYDIDRDPVEFKRRIGVVPEELALFDRLTGGEYLTFVGRMYAVPKTQLRDRVEELLEMMNLHQDPKKLIVDYSHGMKKKLALAASLVHEPRLLFLDEPFEGIDAIASRQIRDLLHGLVRKGVTIFLTSHIMEIVEKLCTDVAIIHRGKLIGSGTMEEFRGGAGLEETFLGLVGASTAPRATLSWLE
jgi:ABC-2 type transport system ATP-binding protein